jgi:hypothetical protein
MAAVRPADEPTAMRARISVSHACGLHCLYKPGRALDVHAPAFDPNRHLNTPISIAHVA